MNYKIEVRVSQIDNGFLVDYWNGESHKVFCSTVDELNAAIQVALALKVVDNTAMTGLAIASQDAMAGVVNSPSSTIVNGN